MHSAPLHEEEGANDSYHWHVEVMPKLTRVAGFEWGTGFYINPTGPEEAADVLRKTKLKALGVGRVRGRVPCVKSNRVWYFNWLQSGNNSVVECDLAKVEVAGSNPVSRSIYLIRVLSLRDAHLCLRRRWRLGFGWDDISWRVLRFVGPHRPTRSGC